MPISITHDAPKRAPKPAPNHVARVVGGDGQLDLKAKGVTTLILTGWKISGSVLYTSVGATLRDYTVVIPVDAGLGPNDYEDVIGRYQILNQNSANPTNQPLKEKTTTLSRTDLITFQ